MNEACLMRLIREYEEDYITQPARVLTKECFDRACFSSWAFDEIVSRLIDEMSRLPPHITGRDPIPYFDIIQEFIDNMNYMAETTTDYHKRFIFLVAKETGNDLLLFLKGDSQ